MARGFLARVDPCLLSGGRSWGACGGLVVAVEHIGIEVEPVGPDDGPQFGIDADAAEVLRVAQRFAHRAPEHVAEVDDALGPIIESKTEGVPLQRIYVGDGHHAHQC